MANLTLKDRGSRKHVLDLAESANFRTSINGIIARSGFQLAPQTRHQPWGRRHVDAWAEYEMEEYFQEAERRIPDLPVIPDDWWIVHKTGKNNRPTWDMIAHLESAKDGKPGILLVEAKAHVAEVKIDDQKSAPSGSNESADNQNQIIRRLSETQTALNRLKSGCCRLTCDDHYQLANRLAYSVKLASLGYNVVLVYLGFCGDTYFADYLTDGDHWQRVIGGYLQGVVPQTFPEHRFPVARNMGSVQMLVGSLPVIGVSH